MRLPAQPRSVITGAGAGLGRALALALAPRGARLVLSDIDVASCEETASMALAAGARSARVQKADVTQIADVERLAEACDEGVDLVVNNAGVVSAGFVGELSLEDWRWTIEVDLFGVVHGCHVFVPLLRKQGHGHILNVASAAGLVSTPRMGSYNVAKAGVVALTETLSCELEGTGIGVTVLCPTFFRTNIIRTGRFTREKHRAIAEKLVDRGGSAETVARAAIESVENGELYAVPMADGRWMWRVKRLAPTTFARFAGAIGKRIAGR